MKLIDILLENEEGGIQDFPKEDIDYSIIPSDMGKALDALSNPDNYVDKDNISFSDNFADREMIDKIFGKGAPHQKDGQAQKDWESLSQTSRVLKLKDIQSREPELFKKGLESQGFEKAYTSWKEEGNDGNEEDFILNSDYNILKIVSKVGREPKYYPIKTKDNIAKYGGTLSSNTHYDIDGEKITFPTRKIKTWGKKDLIKKRIESIMNNAGVEFDTPIETETTSTSTTPTTEKPTLKITLDPKKIKGDKDVEKKIEGLKSTYKKNFSFADKVLVIKNIDKAKKLDLIGFFRPYQKVEDLKEEFDFELYRMQRIANL